MKMTIIINLLISFPLSLFSQTGAEICSESKSIQKNFYNEYSALYPGDPTIDVRYYMLDLDIKVNPDYLYGMAEIILVKTEAGKNFFLDFSDNMTVDSVLVNNKPVSFNHTDNKIYIVPASTSESYNVKIYYQGLPVPTGFGSFRFAFQNNDPVVWTLSEPYGAKDWFPCKDTPADKADSSEVGVTCDQNLIAVSNGLLYETIDNKNGTKTYKWKSSYPISHYLISIAVTNYAEYHFYYRYNQTDSMPVVNYIYPDQLQSHISVLDKTNFMLDLFSEKYGIYPFIKEKYGHAQISIGGAMEHQTCSSMGSINEGIVAHELAHQWFGDMITCQDWNNIWLNEGFATYSEGIYWQNAYGETEFREYLKNIYNFAKLASGSVYLTDISTPQAIFNFSKVYAKGAAILNMLRYVTGDETFFNILRAYTSDTNYAYKTAITEDFQTVTERTYGQDLTYFFHQWIYGVNYPVYQLSWSYEKMIDDLYKVTIVVQQNVNQSPSFFSMPVEFLISTSSGDTLFTEFNNAQQQTFQFDVRGEPFQFTFDPDNHILKDKYGDQPIIPVSFQLLQNYPNPFNPTTTIQFSIAGFGQVTLAVYDALGRLVNVLISNEKMQPGNHSVNLSSEGLASGAYFYQLRFTGEGSFSGSNFTDTKKLVIVR